MCAVLIFKWLKVLDMSPTREETLTTLGMSKNIFGDP